MESKEPEYTVTPPIYLVNNKERLTAIEYNLEPWQLAEYLDKGYMVTDKRTHYEARDKFIDYHQARIRKTQLQKLRRLQGYTPPKRK